MLYDQKDKEKVIALHEQGHSDNDIMRLCNLPKGAVRIWVWRYLCAAIEFKEKFPERSLPKSETLWWYNFVRCDNRDSIYWVDKAVNVMLHGGASREYCAILVARSHRAKRMLMLKQQEDPELFFSAKQPIQASDDSTKKLPRYNIPPTPSCKNCAEMLSKLQALIASQYPSTLKSEMAQSHEHDELVAH